MAKKKENPVVAPCGPDKEWEASNDADQLMRVHEILTDKARFKKAYAKLKEKQNAIRSISDLKRVYAERFTGVDSEKEEE